MTVPFKSHTHCTQGTVVSGTKSRTPILCRRRDLSLTDSVPELDRIVASSNSISTRLQVPNVHAPSMHSFRQSSLTRLCAGRGETWQDSLSRLQLSGLCLASRSRWLHLDYVRSGVQVPLPSKKSNSKTLRILSNFLCRKRDLNPHILRYTILSRARLPFRHSGNTLY
ncbi:MAG: hypothetical protein RI911_724 [Candidatus Parcubacteria bacterium]